MAPAKKTTRKTATKKPTRRKAANKVPAPKAKPEYDPTWHATVEAYVTLRDANAPIPDAIRKPVEKWLAEKQKEEEKVNQINAQRAAERKAADETGPKWIRNLYQSDASYKLESADGKLRRVELKPRGQRGDIFPLKPGDESDHHLIEAIQRGFIEIIGQTTAEEIVENQTRNIQQVHAPLAILRNERGERGENDEGMKLTVEQEFNRQGVTVGIIDQNASPKDKFGGIRRPEQVENFVPTGGNSAIVTSGFDPPAPSVGVTDNANAAIADDLARRAKGAASGANLRPEQALNLGVTITPPVKT